MCGSGTLLVEGADRRGYRTGLAARLFRFYRLEAARRRAAAKRLDDRNAARRLSQIAGHRFRSDRHTVNAALQHIENAGLSGKIHIEKRDIAAASAAESWPEGLIVCNRRMASGSAMKNKPLCSIASSARY